VQGLAEGGYYYHPVHHRLCALSPGAKQERALHVVINRPVFDQASLTIFLVVDLRAIAPLYGPEAHRMACIEAGLMTQLLEQQAAALDIATCHVGYPANDSYRQIFRLHDEHVLLHSLFAGRAPVRSGVPVSAREASGAVTWETVRL
jgi:SagB-type dehydrogenase family enzyme